MNAPTFVVTNASPVGLGAILMQEQKDGERKPVAYISKTLTEVERRYSQIEREALAIVWAVERFNDYLYGISFTIVTDNKPLMSMLCPDSKKISPREYNVCFGDYYNMNIVLSVWMESIILPTQCLGYHVRMT